MKRRFSGEQVCCGSSTMDDVSDDNAEEQFESDDENCEDNDDFICVDFGDEVKQVCYDEENNRRFSTFLLAQRFPHNKKVHYVSLVLFSKKDEFSFEETKGLFGVDKVNKEELSGNFESLSEIFKSRFYELTECEWNKGAGLAVGSEFFEVESNSRQQRQVKKKCLYELNILPSYLDEEIREAIDMMISVSDITRDWANKSADATKLRDLWLSKETIREGLICLNNIAGLIEAKMTHSNQVATESYKFYLTIPHIEIRSNSLVFKNCISIRQTIRVLEDKFELDHKESQMEIVSGEERIRVADDFVLNPLDAKYLSYKNEMTLLNPNSKEFKLLNLYFTETCLNKSYVINIFKCKRQNAHPRLDEEYRLLWHGSGIDNLCGILRDGLHLPKYVHSNTIYATRGIYFADCAAKSLAYAKTKVGSSKCFMFLYNIALGNNIKTIGHHCLFKNEAGDSDVMKYDAGCELRDLKVLKTESGSVIHIGKPTVGPSGRFNEYIVFNEKRIQLAYLVQIHL